MIKEGRGGELGYEREGCEKVASQVPRSLLLVYSGLSSQVGNLTRRWQTSGLDSKVVGN